MRRLGLASFLVAAIVATAMSPLGAARTVVHKSTAIAIAAGGDHSCALLSNGTAECWGDNSFGQLGNGTTDASTKPVPVKGLTGAVAITAGFAHSCALLKNGTARCWGDNDLGELGNGSRTDAARPVAVQGLTGAVAITAGFADSCALLKSGTAKCWGDNSFGELGDGKTHGPQSCDNQACNQTPVPVIGLTSATAITAGFNHVCAVLRSGTAACWGDNNVGELGNGTTTSAAEPVVVSGLTGVQAITNAGATPYSCALLASGSAECWGANSSGQLGNGGTIDSPTAVNVTGLNGATAITAGGDHACALLATGSAACWGDNSSGQLGNGGTTNSQMPLLVKGLIAVAVRSGSSHSCALLNNGSVTCWGNNVYGQLGNGTSINASAPVTVRGL